MHGESSSNKGYKNFNALQQAWWERESLKPLNSFFSKTWIAVTAFQKFMAE